MGKHRRNPNASLVLLSLLSLRTVFDTQCVRRCSNTYFYALFIFLMRFEWFSMRNYAFTRLICSSAIWILILQVDSFNEAVLRFVIYIFEGMNKHSSCFLMIIFLYTTLKVTCKIQIKHTHSLDLRTDFNDIRQTDKLINSTNGNMNKTSNNNYETTYKPYRPAIWILNNIKLR